MSAKEGAKQERELEMLRQRVAELEAAVTACQRDAEASRFLASIVKQSQDAVIVTGLDFAITYVNRATEALYGYAAAELLGREPGFLNAALLAAGIQQEIYETVSSGGTWFGEHLNRRKDGSTFVGSFKVSPLVDEQGQILGYLGIQRDVSEQYTTKELLREAKEYAELLIDTANVMIVGLDMEGNITVYNQAAEQIAGYTQAELVGRNWFEVLVPRDRYPQVWDVFTRLPEGTMPRTFENPILAKSGEERIISWRNSELVQGDTLVGSISFGMDITERKRAEETLQQRVAQLNLLNHVSQEISTLLQPEQLMERAVYLAQLGFGYHHVALFTLEGEQGELVMKARAGSFTDLFPDDYRLPAGRGLVGWVARYAETLVANDVELEPRYYNHHPGRIPTRSELSVPIEIGGQLLGVLDVQSPERDAFDFDDVLVIETLAHQLAVAMENARLYESLAQELAERRQAQAAMAHYAAELARSNQELEQFAYAVSHDLQEPLRMVSSYLNLL